MGQKALRVAVVGAGAIGCRIAAHLAQAGTQATLFDGWREHVDALNQNGLTLEGPSDPQTFPVQAHHFDEISSLQGSFDVVLLAVRSDGTAAALPLVASLLAPDGCVVSCQNGINEDAIANALGEDRTLGCSLVLGARLTGPGRVRLLEGADTLKVGELDGRDSDRVQTIAKLLSACGTATVTPNLLGYRWMKLVLNATGNPLLLLSGLTADALHNSQARRCLIIALAAEVLTAAHKAGISVEPILGVPASRWTAPNAVHDMLLHDCLLAHGNALGSRRLSMAADFEARGRTEVEHINGYVVAKAAQQGTEAPLNAEVVRLVKALEAGELAQAPESLASLEALVSATL